MTNSAGGGAKRGLLRRLSGRGVTAPRARPWASLRRTKPDSREAMMGTVTEAWIERGYRARRTAGRMEGWAATGLRLPALRVRAVMALAAVALSSPLLAACVANSHSGLLGNGSGLSVSHVRSVEGPGSGGLGVGAAGTPSGMPGYGRLPKAVSEADAHDPDRYGEAWESARGHVSLAPAAPRLAGGAHRIAPAYGAGVSIRNASGIIVPPGEDAAAPVGAPPAGVRSPLSSTAAAGDAVASVPASGRHIRKHSPRNRNLSAADLSTSWNRTRTVAATLGLAAPAAARAGALKRALGNLKAPHAGTAGSATLPGVPIGSVSVLGERDGIAYGVWKGGPAGTMPVTFHFGPHDTPSGSGFVDWKGGVSPEFMAVLRRSTKIWTRRLASDGKRRDVTIKVVEDGRYKAVDTVEDVEGIVLQVRLNDVGRVSGGPISYDSGTDGNRFMPVYGNISISSHVHDNLHDGMAHSIAHEFGHVLGISAYGFGLYEGSWYDAEAHTWSGPNALRANGGKPVPLQWVNGRKWWEVAEPHAEGARRDAAHLGVCSSVMAYCADANGGGGAPSELDFAILADFGFDVLDAKVAAEPERYGHAAWGEWAAWGVSVERDLRDNFHGTPDDWTPLPHDFTRAHADAFGTVPATALSDNAALRGQARWKGSLLGVDLGSERLPPVVGVAKLRVDLDKLDGELRLRNLTVHLGGGGQAIRTRPFRQPDLRYDVDISGNGFASARNRVQGGFHGPAHAEMVGVVRDVRPEVQLLGGFGGVRATVAVPGRHLQQNGPQTTNTRAADLRASWNDATPVTAAVGLAPLTTDRAGAAKRALGRLRTLHAGAEGPKSALHKVPADAIAMLGGKDGIAWGAWKGGTAGTMPVGLHLDAAPGLSEGSKAMLRRAAKIWSKHLVDDGQRHDVTLDDGTVVRDVEGVLVQIRLHNQNVLLAGPKDYGRGPDGKGFRPISGRVRLSLETASRLEDGIASILAHEVGHTLGAVATGVALFPDYYDPDSHTWSGPHAMRANGGKPVPLQWVLGGRIVAPNTPGAIRDTHHLGPCTALLSSCFDRSVVLGPTALDLAFLADLGVAILAPDVAAETERYGHAAWGDWAAWGVGVERDLQSNHVQTPRDFLRAHADAFGTAPATTLSDNAALRGKAVWNGSLLGVDLGNDRLPPVVGDAKLRVDLGKLEGELRLSNLTVHADGGAAVFRQPALAYAVDVDGNGFADARNRVQGSFHGPTHEEMAGVVKDTRARVGLLAGFGGVRDAD